MEVVNKMAKTILGVDIGYDSLKLALVNGTQVRKTAIIPMPQHLVREGRVVSTETMGELIRRSMKENGIRCGRAAIALPNETVFIRGVTMPQMTVDQLEYNLPFEFRDYITEELKDYYYDYAMISTPEELAISAGESGGEEALAGGSMDLMAVAAPKTLIEESRELLHKAGLKMVKAAPTVSAYQALIRATQGKDEEPREYCILDLGYQAIRMYMFHGDKHMVTRVLEIGMNSLDQVISEAYSVDIHLAHTYLLSNYENCRNGETCMNAYGNITVELMRALNFYRFSNPDSHLQDIWVCGGGAVIEPLRQSIAETLDLKIHFADELIPGSAAVENDYALLQAIGIAIN